MTARSWEPSPTPLYQQPDGLAYVLAALMLLAAIATAVHYVRQCFANARTADARQLCEALRSDGTP